MLEITIQRRVDGGWPVVAERHKPGTLLPVRSEGRLESAGEPSSSGARAYGTTLGCMLFRDAIRDAFVQARSDQPDGVRVLVFVEAEELKAWRWEWLCAPVDSATWDFLSLDQRVLYSLYLPSLTDRAYPPIGRNDLRALVVVANPADPEKRYGLASFDVGQNVTRLRSIFGAPTPATVLARVDGAAGAPTLDAIETHLTGATADHPYTILHLVCHGWVNPQGEGETTLYLERPSPDPASGQVLAQPVQGSELIARLRRVGRLPYLVFLSACESAAPEAEQRLGGLAQRLVRELGIPAVVGMTERVTIATAHALAEQFYNRLLAQTTAGEVDRALVEAYAGLAARADVNVPALYSRLGTQPLFSTALDRPLTAAEIKAGLQKLDDLLAERAPVLRLRLAESAGQLRSTLDTSPEALTGKARQERDQALTRVNELCSEVVEISFHALAQGEQPPAYDARQPFRGLSPFRAEDREFFFGRDSLAEKLEKKLSADNFLAVFGPSGSGKSSLVLAGLAPKLKAQIPGLQVVDDLTPGSAPLEQLRVRQSRLGPGPILYIVDQFEELFTLCKDQDQRHAFIDELLTLAQSHRVVLTMRADFWGECARYTALKDRMLACQELVAPMTAAELRSSMEQQAAKVGLRFEADLSNSMLDEVAGEPGAMPLLQHALLELWKRRHGRWLRAEEYRAIGGVKQAIAETADRIYNEASAAEQDGIRDIFVRLTQIDDNVVRGEDRRDTRRRLSLAEVLPAGGDPGQIRDLVKRLADNVLVVTSRNELTGQQELEVSHEALIRHWARLRKWLNDDLIGLRLRDRISDAVREWKRNPADESLLVHRGSRLVAAEELLINRRLPLTAEEQEYLKQCREAETAQLGKEREQLKATARLQTRIAWLLGGVGLVIAVAVMAVWYLQWDKQRQLTRRQIELDHARANILAEITETKLLRGEFDSALRMALRGVRIDLALPQDEVKVSAATAALAAAVSQAKWHFSLSGHNLHSPAFSSDGSRIVIAAGDNTARIWDAASAREITVLRGHDKYVTSAAFSRDGSHIVTASQDNTARIWDAASGKEIAALRGHRDTVHSAAFSTDGSRIVTASLDRTARVWDAANAKEVAVLCCHDSGVEWAAFSPDGSRIVTTSGADRTARIWDVASAKEIAVRAYDESVGPAAFSPDGSRIVIALGDGTARIWDAASTKEIAVLRGHDKYLRSAAFSPDGSRIVTASADGTSRIWDAASTKGIAVLRGHNGEVNSAAFSPDGSRIITASADDTVRIWEAASILEIAVLGHDDAVHSAAFSRDGSRIVTASLDRTARIWDAATAEEIGVLRGHTHYVYSAAFSPDGSRIVTASWDGTARIWDAANTEEIAVLRSPDMVTTAFTWWAKDNVNSAAFSPDGSHIVTASGDSTARIWDAASGKEIAVLRSRDIFGLKGAAFNRDGSRIITASGDGNARIWDAASGKEIAGLPADNVKSVAFSPDGSRIVTASGDGTARIWDAASGNEIANLRGYVGAVNSVAFSHDGSRIVTASDGRTARIWDVASGKEIAGLFHDQSVASATFSPDGSRIVTASWDGKARIWDAHLETMSVKGLLVEACTRLGDLTKLTRDEMRLAGYPDSVPEIDVCERTEGIAAPGH